MQSRTYAEILACSYQDKSRDASREAMSLRLCILQGSLLGFRPSVFEIALLSELDAKSKSASRLARVHLIGLDCWSTGDVS